MLSIAVFPFIWMHFSGSVWLAVLARGNSDKVVKYVRSYYYIASDTFILNSLGFDAGRPFKKFFEGVELDHHHFSSLKRRKAKH